MAEKGKSTAEAHELDRLREEHQKVVNDCEGRIKHWKKVAGDYEALNERLETLPDQLSYDITVPFGPLAFVPGKMVHTNEVTVLLGDNWFAKCSAKQAQKIVDHRIKYVNKELEELLLTKKNFEARVEFTEDLEKMTGKKGDFVDIKEDVESKTIISTKGKHRLAHKHNSKPKMEVALDLEEKGSGDRDGGSRKGLLSEEELWARLDELERQEEEQEKRHRLPDNTAPNDKDTSSSSEEEEEEEGDGTHGINRPEHATVTHTHRVDSTARPAVERIDEEEEDDEDEEANSLPTIHFSHTVEPKKVRINTRKNTTLKFSERKEQKEQAKRKKKNGDRNGHSHQELYKISSPTDIYRVFVDVKNGELLPRKSILKSRSRENSVCSDTSESSAADFEERRVYGRALSHDDVTHSDTSDGVTEEESPTTATPRPACRYEAFSGTVVEKEHIPTALPHLAIIPPALPTILERRQEEVAPEISREEVAPKVPREQAAVSKEPPKRVSKFKAGRQQQHK